MCISELQCPNYRPRVYVGAAIGGVDRIPRPQFPRTQLTSGEGGGGVGERETNALLRLLIMY